VLVFGVFLSVIFINIYERFGCFFRPIWAVLAILLKVLILECFSVHLSLIIINKLNHYMKSRKNFELQFNCIYLQVFVFTGKSQCGVTHLHPLWT